MGMFFGWETIYMTSNLQEFATMRGRLLDNGIKTKTRTDNNSFGGTGQSRIAIGSSIRTNYEILVKKEDVHKANHAIHGPK